MAAHLTLDVATKVITASQNIWAMFPGKGKKFLDDFLANNAVFLDFPAIELTPRVLSDDKLLRQHVAMSLKWRSYLSGATDKVPSRKPASFTPVRSRSFYAAVASVHTVYERMQPGDLILFAGRDIYEPIHIGEIKEPFDAKHSVQIKAYDREDIPSRKIRWINVRVERRFLSERLSALLSNDHAVIRLPKEEFGDEVYRIAYGDYVFGTSSRYLFRGPSYKNIAVSTVAGIDLISYFCAAFNAVEIGEIDAFSKLEIREAINSYFESDDLYSFEIDFKSPAAIFAEGGFPSVPLQISPG